MGVRDDRLRRLLNGEHGRDADDAVAGFGGGDGERDNGNDGRHRSTFAGSGSGRRRSWCPFGGGPRPPYGLTGDVEPNALLKTVTSTTSTTTSSMTRTGYSSLALKALKASAMVVGNPCPTRERGQQPYNTRKESPAAYALDESVFDGTRGLPRHEASRIYPMSPAQYDS